MKVVILTVLLAFVFVLLVGRWLDRRQLRSESVILHWLSDEKEHHGLEIRPEIGASVYIHLASMEERGLIVSRVEQDTPIEIMQNRGFRPRRLYSITASGLQKLTALVPSEDTATTRGDNP